MKWACFWLSNDANISCLAMVLSVRDLCYGSVELHAGIPYARKDYLLNLKSIRNSYHRGFGLPLVFATKIYTKLVQICSYRFTIII